MVNWQKNKIETCQMVIINVLQLHSNFDMFLFAGMLGILTVVLAQHMPISRSIPLSRKLSVVSYLLHIYCPKIFSTEYMRVN